MPHSYGYRARTRDLFCKDAGKAGTIALNRYLKVYKLGQIVDVVADGGVHKGMPHKFYHGKTGRIWNVAKRAVGVVINKQVGHRLIPKKIHVRIEHVRPSKCQQDFHDRVKKNKAALTAWFKAGGKKSGQPFPNFKRQHVGPRDATTVRVADTTVKHITPEKYISYYV
jgi:large subunit ribosomal protein L21e